MTTGVTPFKTNYGCYWYYHRKPCCWTWLEVDNFGPKDQSFDSSLGKCVPPPCPQDQHYDIKQRKCIPDRIVCPPPSHYDPVLKRCIRPPLCPPCPPGYHCDPFLHRCIPNPPPPCKQDIAGLHMDVNQYVVTTLTGSMANASQTDTTIMIMKGKDWSANRNQ